MKLIVSILVAGILLAMMPSEAASATLGTYTHDYGRKKYVPQGSNNMRGNAVEIDENASDPFYDSFDFSDLAGSTIDSITLTLDFRDAGPTTWGPFLLEAWDVHIEGTDTGPTSNTFVGRLDDNLSPQDFVLDGTTDSGSNTSFADAITNFTIGFWFDEPGFINPDTFRLRSATLTINGTPPAVVPLPAPVWLLLSALGGLAIMRRRQRKSANA